MKKKVAESQESKYCKLGYRLELIIIQNLIKDSREGIAIHQIHSIIEDGLVQCKSLDKKILSLQDNINFILYTSFLNENKKLCSLEYKSKCIHSIQ